MGFRSTFRESKLNPDSCPFFEDEKLLYLFYGRPAYRLNGTGSVNSDTSFPVCFILYPECITSAKRVYPFDSGAFFMKMYENFIFERYTINHFLVNPNTTDNSEISAPIPCPDTPSRIVTAFFEDNYRYYWGDCNHLIPFSAFDLEAKDYSELIRNRGSSSFDDRRATIEIQLKEPVILSDKTVCAVVLPNRLMDDEEINRKIIQEWKANRLIYHTYLSNPAHFTAVIIEIVGAFLKEEGYFGEQANG